MANQPSANHLLESDTLSQIKERLDILNQQLARPETVQDADLLRRTSKEHAELTLIAQTASQLTDALQQQQQTSQLLNTSSHDDSMTELIQQELATLQNQIDTLTQTLSEQLYPADPLGNRDAIVEIRAAAGGDEAGLFAGDLYRMYLRYAEQANWTIETISLHEGGIGQIKEVVFQVQGSGAFGTLRYESGVHRVQRVPETESQGRIHTSTVTVAVLPVAEEVDVEVQDKDLRIDIFHSGGAGGQNVNKVATAVRITHLPTNTVVVCQNERSQLKNRQQAMEVLRSRLLDAKIQEQAQQISSDRSSQIGSGDRSEKIRTYNFPQDRITDHRINQSWHHIQDILAGNLDPIFTSLKEASDLKQQGA